MAAKNHHIILVGPTDSQGVVEFPWVRVEHQVDRVRRFFIMDYAGLDQWTGRASVMFMDISEVERYLKAAETWRSSSLHPRDEVDTLRSYRAFLLEFPVEDVDIVPDASPPGSVQFVSWA